MGPELQPVSMREWMFFARMILNLNARTAGEEREEKTQEEDEKKHFRSSVGESNWFLFQHFFSFLLHLNISKQRKNTNYTKQKCFALGPTGLICHGQFRALVFIRDTRGQNWHTQNAPEHDKTIRWLNLCAGIRALNSIIYRLLHKRYFIIIRREYFKSFKWAWFIEAMFLSAAGKLFLIKSMAR